jgi:hypothetical protein
VRLFSQLGGAQPGHLHRFPGLSHIPLPLKALLILPPGLSNDNVEESLDVKKLVACWLTRSGNSACLAGVPASVTASIAKAAPANKNPGLPANFTPVAANAAGAIKNAVPMPHVTTKHPQFCRPPDAALAGRPRTRKTVRFDGEHRQRRTSGTSCGAIERNGHT